MVFAACMACLSLVGRAQYIATPDSISRALVSTLGLSDSLGNEKSAAALDLMPRINYTDQARQYIVGKVTVHGALTLEPQMIINNFGIAAGDTIHIPGDEITIATRNMLDRRFFANMKVGTTFRQDTVDLDIFVRERVAVREWQFLGIKSNEQKDLEEKLKLRRNRELSDYLLQTSLGLIREYYDDKAFRNADITYRIIPDTLVKTAVVVQFEINRGNRVRIGEIQFDGNENLTQKQLRKSLEKTHKVSINFLKSFKFKQKDFEEDLENVRNFARSRGYRDAEIVKDSTYSIPEKPKRMGVYIKIKEGHKYHYRNISWLGNTLYSTQFLKDNLGLEKGDVYDSETMDSRLSNPMPNEFSIANLYKNSGYLAFVIDPIETVVPGDSVDVEVRMIEGSQFRVKNVSIEGNTRTNDHVIRREIYSRPGELYSQDLLMRTYQRLAGMGQFDASSLFPGMNPNMQQEVVDLNYNLTEVSNDQLELSGGWGAGMFIASVGVKFTNVSIRNFFKKDAWRPYPAGDNQTLSLNIQTNGTYYRALSASFMEPWLGGKKPTSFSISFFTSRETNSYNITKKATAYFGTMGGSVGFGKRLSWPDPYFTFSMGVTLQSYKLYNWDYFIVKNGRSNTLALNFSLSRNSVDDITQYPTRGSNLSLSLAVTPPWSSFDGKDYSQKDMADKDRYKWIEYHKWNLNAQWFFPLDRNNKLVLMARAQFGYLGYYNKNKKSPFEGFQMGGDGLSGYSMYGVETIGLRGYGENALTPSADYGVYASIFNKYIVEMRYPIIRTGGTMVYGLIFAEAGNAFTNLSDYKPFSLKRSAGFGLRVYLPFLGMLGVDWGYGFDKTSSTNGKASGGKLSFTMGMPL